MKKLIATFLIFPIFILITDFAYDTGGPFQVNYIVQNPAYYPNAVGYFRISGMHDKVLQKRTNDTLLKWFCKPTGFFKPTGKISNRLAHRSVDKNETFWVYRQMCRIHDDSLEGIVFKNSDSLKVLGYTGYIGSGESICTWGTSILQNRILVITIEYNPKTPNDSFEDPLVLDLKTLQRAKLKATMRFQENQKTAMVNFMQARIEKKFIEQDRYQAAKVILQAPDSIPLTQWQVLDYSDDKIMDLYMPYTLDGINSMGDKIHLEEYFIFKSNELSPFSDGKFADEIESLFR